MEPVRFTLEFSMQCIRLLHDLNGTPTVLGDVSIDAPEIDMRMASLLKRALGLSEPPIWTAVFVPADYVLFRTAYSEIMSEKLRQVLEEEVRQEAMARTHQQDPDEICVVSTQVGSHCLVAAIEHEVLRGASDFVRKHGFEPAVLTSHSPKGLFQRPPIFPCQTNFLKDGLQAISQECQFRKTDAYNRMIAQIDDLQSTLDALQAQLIMFRR